VTVSAEATEKVSSHSSHWKSSLPEIPLFIMAVAVVIYLGTAGKPLWLDEVLHFALGSMSFEQVLRTIDYTSIELNHGQTGTYLLTDWALMQIFGANTFTLRLPSLLGAVVMFWAAWVFMKNRGFSWPWQYLVFLALLSQSFLVSYINEARPYMPLVGAVVALLAFYTATASQRKTPAIRVLGVVGIVFGATMQPYWVLYWLMLLVFGALVIYLRDHNSFSLRSTVSFIGPAYVIPGLILFVVIGQLTWLRRVRTFDFDPYFMIGSRDNAIDRFLVDHIYGSFSATMWLVVLVLFMVTLTTVRPWRHLIFLAPPVILWVLGVASSLLLTYLSISRNYWIFERQWLPGIALCAVAIAWFAAELFRQTGRKNLLAWISAYAIAVVYLTGAYNTTRAIQGWSVGWQEQQIAFNEDQRSIEELTTSMDDNMLVYAANINAARGGAVWPEFISWYKNQAGMRPEFRETNPSWMDSWFGVGFSEDR